MQMCGSERLLASLMEFEPLVTIVPLCRTYGMQKQVVVLVDDEREVIAALRRLFRDESFEVLATSDPQDALDWIRTRDVGALVADDRMPVMSGTTLFYLAKANSPSTARIMVTGHACENIILHGHKQGLFRVFAKPWDDQELRRAIRERLRERELGLVGPAWPAPD